MSVHYKFKSALNSDTVTFDGLHISVGDLKKAIIHQKRLGKTVDFDLQITNAQTKEEYSDNNTLIPKNTSLIVARIPLAVQPKKQWDIQAEKQQQQQAHRHNNAPEPDGGALDLSQMNGTEEDKIQAMMIQSTMDYDPNNYQVIRGQSQVGEVPANYRCFKCRKPGHWIKNCPLSSNGEVNDFKRNTGIPRSFIERDANDKNSPANAEPLPPPVAEKKQEIPEDLICAICKDLFTDAVMIPCCGSSFCDECVRTALLESEDNECPDCKEKGSSPGSLIPNRFLRNSVNAFKNETGYSKPRPQKPPPKPKEAQEAPAIAEEPVEKKEEEPKKEQKMDKMEKKDSEEKSTVVKASSVPAEAPHKEKPNETELHEKKNDPGHHSSHDEIESDFEDNITVTVPAAHLISHQRSEFRERPYNGRHSRHLRPPGMDGSPKNSSQSTPSRVERSGTPPPEEKDHGHHDHLKHHHQIPSHQAPHRGEPIRPHRSTPSDMYGPGAPITSYPPTQGPMMAPGRPYEMGGYGPPPGPGYPPYMMDARMRGPFHPIRPGYPQPHQMRPRMMAPPGSLASVYHGVAAKVGPGIIDDPLEAFNRIMREKEKRKEERRRAPPESRRRSRSIELNAGRGGGRGHSPPSHHGRSQRMRSPDDRRMRSPQMRDRRARSRDKRSPRKEKRRHRSSSFSDRSRSRSRSRSWSNPPNYGPWTPEMQLRSRSRSPSFTVGRYRQKENRRPERREDFPPRDEFRDRDRSPANYPPRRGRSPRRGQSPPPQHNKFYGRQERQGHGGPPPDQYFNIPPGPSGPYNDCPQYGQNNSGNNRYPDRGSHHREHYGRDRNNDYKMDRFDDGPPGIDEPPPPGFETSPPSPRERRNSWGNNPFDDRNDRGNFRQEIRKDPVTRNRGHTPNDIREKHTPLRERDDPRHHDSGRERETRSWSKGSRQSSQNHGRRRSRSKTPVRMDRIAEEYSANDRNKERGHGSRDYQPHERERDKGEHDRKRDREERERKHSEREKKELERKQHEKDLKKAAREEKEKEKEKEKEREREREKEREREREREKDGERSREKKRDSSDDEKKDKKSKEKRKKKKEKDAERKKNKKEKKEKKEREKEREKEKELNKKEDSKTEESFESTENEHVHEASSHEQQEKTNVMPDTQLLPPSTEQPESEKESDSNLEEGEIHENEGDAQSETKHLDPHESEILELYGDICQDEEIKYDYSNTVSASSEIELQGHGHNQDHKRSSPPDFKRFDSVLDIHANLDFEPDIEEIETNEQKKEGNPYASIMPELSKWERDDAEVEIVQTEEEPVESILPEVLDDKAAKVTTEVLKRAENAIFARAINAIRPIEIKKISVERQKLYSNDPSRELSPVPTVIQIKSPNRDLVAVQITVPANNNCERSVEIKSEKQKSIKDRLGSKITEPTLRRHRSKSPSPGRKSAMEKLRIGRSRSREREGGGRREERDVRRTSEVKRAEAGSNRGRDRNQPDVNRGRDQGRVAERRRDYEQDRSGGSRGDRNDRNERVDRGDRMDRERDREKDRERERVSERDRDRGRGWEQNRGREKDRNRDEPRERDRDRNRERGDGDWGRSGNKSRERQNMKDDKKVEPRNDDSRNKGRNKSKERDRQTVKKRDQSASPSSERNRDKPIKNDRDHKRKHGEDRAKTPPEKKSRTERPKENEKGDSNITREKNQHRKKSTVDEVVLEQRFEQAENITSSKGTESLGTSRQSKDKTKTPEVSGRSGSAAKRSRSPSESSSSSSSSSSDSDSDSDDGKKKKRNKHKKNKKKSRRSSSVESAESGKHKRSKSKKKKNSKKKKKSKK